MKLKPFHSPYSPEFIAALGMETWAYQIEDGEDIPILRAEISPFDSESRNQNDQNPNERTMLIGQIEQLARAASITDEELSSCVQSQGRIPTTATWRTLDLDGLRRLTADVRDAQEKIKSRSIPSAEPMDRDGQSEPESAMSDMLKQTLLDRAACHGISEDALTQYCRKRGHIRQDQALSDLPVSVAQAGICHMEAVAPLIIMQTDPLIVFACNLFGATLVSSPQPKNKWVARISGRP